MTKISHGTVPSNGGGNEAHTTADFLNNITRVQMSQAGDGTKEISHPQAKEQRRRGQVGFPSQSPHQEGKDGPTQEIDPDGCQVIFGVICISGSDSKGRNQKGCIRDPVET